MATTSTVPLVKDTLLALLRARAGLAEVQVERADPVGKRKKDLIYLGDVRGRQEIASIRAGRKSRNETYELEVVCYAEVRGRNVATSDAEDRVFALFAEVQDQVADDPQLGLVEDGVAWTTVQDFSLDSGPTDTGANAVIAVSLEVKARLS